jgi:hypothetical protein
MKRIIGKDSTAVHKLNCVCLHVIKAFKGFGEKVYIALKGAVI